MRRLGALVLLLLAAAAPVAKKPAPAVPAAKPADIAEQLAMLNFDANPQWAVPPRLVFSRWAGPLRLFVFGRPEDRADAAEALRALARPSGLSMRVVAEQEVARLPPNVFLVADANLPAAFRGPLREMLRNAFLDDDAAVDGFIAAVVETAPCWVLPVWTGADRQVLKAAVIGADAGRKRAETKACVLRALGGGIGLLGPGAYLPASAFAPQGAAKLSRDDERMLRVMYGKAVQPGMAREAMVAEAVRALGPAPVGKAVGKAAGKAAGKPPAKKGAKPPAKAAPAP